MKKAIAMKCSQKDWDSIKSRIPEEKIQGICSFIEYPYLANNFNEKGIISNTGKNNSYLYEIHETFNAKIFLNACGIYCEPEYSITKLQLTQLLKNNEEGNEQLVSADLRAWFPDAFKNKLEVGKWYKNLDNGYEKSICCVIEVNKEDKDCFSGYGIDYVGEYFYEPIDTTFCGSNNWQEATIQEVEAALICEAKKRGFVDGGYYQWINCPLRKVYGSNFIFDKNILRINGFTIMDADGQWAQIIETITIQEAEKLLNKKIV